MTTETSPRSERLKSFRRKWNNFRMQISANYYFFVSISYSSLDESMQVAEMFLREFGRMTGWVGVLVWAGPVPRMGGELGMKRRVFPFWANTT